MMKLELIADYACITGEGPLWHPLEQRLYWVDIPTGRMFRYEPATGQHEQCFAGEPIGGFTIQADGALLLFMARGVVALWRDGVLAPVMPEIPEERESRFNDVIADPEGRVFCGTMPTGKRGGTLYRLDVNGALTRVLEGVQISNGMGFSPDLTQFYYTESLARTIWVFDYDRATGDLSHRRVFARVPNVEGEGVPDGLTVDAEGYIWSARWDGGCLVRYRPNGKEDSRIHFPARKVSCATFAGPDTTDLYVTTAGGDDKVANGPGAGALFRLRPGVQGRPEFCSRLQVK
ncbi:MAG: SMP-30/gluconolactonase/LRE family protein [Anaerolineae bacterium]|nr:SMP-30/gluconolactonase/LRE family protein [Anaerolineae bacterium]